MTSGANGIHAQSSNYTFTSVVQVGDPPPGQGEYRFSRLGGPQVNNQGDLLFGGLREIYLRRQGHIQRVAQRGDPSPLGPTIDAFRGRGLNDQGEVLFGTRLTDQRQALSLVTAAALRTVVSTSQFMPTGGQVEEIFGSALNNQGAVAFFATLRGGSSATGIFLVFGDTIRTVVASGQSSPLGGVFQYTFPPHLDLNDRGEVTFVGEITGGSVPDGLFLFRDGTIEPLVARGDSTPVGGQFNHTHRPQINNRGQVLFEASLSGAPVRDGVFVWSEGAIRKVVALGDVTPIGGRFLEFDVTESPGGIVGPPNLQQPGTSGVCRGDRRG